MKSIAQARIKRARALKLASEGQSYDSIAEAVGYGHRGSAHRAVFKALEECEVEHAESFRAMEVARLDRLQVALWDRALAGDADAGTAVVRIIELRSRLLGLLGTKADDRRKDAPAFLVVGPIEGNPETATLDDVYRWSAREQRADD